MVTNAEAPEPKKTTKAEVAERAAVFAAEAERGARALLTGSGSGRVRRNLLFVVALVGYLVPALSVVGLVALLLLALTDLIVE